MVKKFALFFSLFAAGTGFASLPAPCKVTALSFCGSFLLGITGLYWRPTVGQTDYAQIFEGTDFDLGLGNNHFVNLNHRYDWGFKADVGYLFPCSATELNLTYTNFNHHQRDFVTTPLEFLEPTLSTFDFSPDFAFGPIRLDAINSPALFVSTAILDPSITISLAVPGQTVALIPPVVLFPATDFPILAPAPTLASATARVDHHAFDLDLKQHILVGCRSDFNWFAGLRYAHIDHKLNAAYTATGHELFTENTSVDITGVLTGATITVAAGEESGTVIDEPAFDGTVTANLDIDIASNFRQVIDQHSRFQGIGPRIGCSGTYQFVTGIGIVGELSSSLLVGSVRNNLNENFVVDSKAEIVSLDIDGFLSVVAENTVDETPVLIIVTPVALDSFNVTLPVVDARTATLTRSFEQNDDLRVVPNIDLKLGLVLTGNFTCSNTKYRAEIGYLASHYFKAQDRLSAVETTFSTSQIFDTSFEGPYLSICFAL